MMLRKTTVALALMILALAAGSADPAVAGTTVEYGPIWDW
jgi:hypothetical protein